MSDKEKEEPTVTTLDVFHSDLPRPVSNPHPHHNTSCPNLTTG